MYYITWGVIMIKIHLSTILGKYRMTQAELSRKTGIRPATSIMKCAIELILNIWIEYARF